MPGVQAGRTTQREGPQQERRCRPGRVAAVEGRSHGLVGCGGSAAGWLPAYGTSGAYAVVVVVEAEGERVIRVKLAALGQLRGESTQTDSNSDDGIVRPRSIRGGITSLETRRVVDIPCALLPPSWLSWAGRQPAAEDPIRGRGCCRRPRRWASSHLTCQEKRHRVWLDCRALPNPNTVDGPTRIHQGRSPPRNGSSPRPNQVPSGAVKCQPYFDWKMSATLEFGPRSPSAAAPSTTRSRHHRVHCIQS